MQVWPGHRYPLGAVYDGMGTNFAVFSEVAEAVELCLFDDDDNERRIPLPEVDAFVWHGYLPGIEPGSRPALQPAQAAAGPVRAGHRRRHRLGPRPVRVRVGLSRVDVHPGLGAA